MSDSKKIRRHRDFSIDDETNDIIREYAIRHHKSMSQAVTDLAWEASEKDARTVPELQK